MRGGQLVKTSPPSVRGERLRDRLLKKFGSLRAASSASGVAHPTLWKYFTVTDIDFHPRESVLRALERTLGDPYDDLLKEWGPVTHEAAMRREQPACAVCGRRSKLVRPSRQRACSWACSTLSRVRRRVRTDLGRLLWAVMALAAGVPQGRIPNLGVLEAVTDQTALRRTVVAIRDTLVARPQELLPVTAEAVGAGYETLRRLLAGRYRWGGRNRAVPVHFTGTIHVAPMLGLTEDAYIRLGGFKGTMAEFSSANLTKQRHPKKLAGCDTVREVVIRRHYSTSPDQMIELIEKRDIQWVTYEKQIPEFLAQHARRCTHCRPGVAYDLRHTAKLAIPKIADMLGISERTVAGDLQRGNNFIHQWQFRLRIWPDLGLQSKPPGKPV